MSEAKFTKGEWEVLDGKVVMCGKFKIAYTYSGHATPYLKDISANAHLIAAAPKMYEMLDKFVRCVDDDSSEDFLYQYQDIKNLLAKARGEA